MRVSSAATNADVAKFNFDDLEKIANGKYNKGEVLLSKDGKLMTVNNHVSMTSWNDIVSSSEQNRAVREAVAKALTDQYEQFSTVADYERRNSSEAAKAVAEFLTDESNQNLPLSRDELRKLLQICTPQYRSSADHGIKYQGDFESELEVIRDFGQVKRSADETKLNAFVGTLNEKLGDSSARLGTDIQSWVKGLSVANLDAKTRATVLKQSDNQTINLNCERIRVELGRLDVSVGLKKGISKENYDQINQKAIEMSDLFEQATAETIMPTIQKGEVPSVKDFRKFLLSASEKMDNVKIEVGDVGDLNSEDLGDRVNGKASLLVFAREKAFFSMLAKNDMLIRAFIKNSSSAYKNLCEAVGGITDERAGSLGNDICKILTTRRPVYLLNMPVDAAVNELLQMGSTDYINRMDENALISITDALGMLRNLDTQQTNAIMSGYFRKLGQQIIDSNGVLDRSGFKRIFDFLTGAVLKSDFLAWFSRCAQNRVLNAVAGMNCQPEWVMGNMADDIKLAEILIQRNEGLSEDKDKDKIEAIKVNKYSLDFARPTELPEKLKTELQANVKLRRLLGEMLAPQYEGRIQHFKPANKPRTVNTYSVLTEISSEIRKQLATFLPSDIKLSHEARTAYEKLTVKMYLYNNPDVSVEKLLADRRNLRSEIMRERRVAIIENGVGGMVSKTVEGLFGDAGLSPVQRNNMRAVLKRAIFEAIKSDVSDGWLNNLAGKVSEKVAQALETEDADARVLKSKSDSVLKRLNELVSELVAESIDKAAEEADKMFTGFDGVYATLNEIAMEEQDGANINNINNVNNGGNENPINVGDEINERNPVF